MNTWTSKVSVNCQPRKTISICEDLRHSSQSLWPIRYTVIVTSPASRFRGCFSRIRSWTKWAAGLYKMWVECSIPAQQQAWIHQTARSRLDRHARCLKDMLLNAYTTMKAKISLKKNQTPYQKDKKHADVTNKGLPSSRTTQDFIRISMRKTILLNINCLMSDRWESLESVATWCMAKLECMGLSDNK